MFALFKQSLKSVLNSRTVLYSTVDNSSIAHSRVP